LELDGEYFQSKNKEYLANMDDKVKLDANEIRKAIDY
jgi:hypothetical protein